MGGWVVGWVDGWMGVKGAQTVNPARISRNKIRSSERVSGGR